MSKISKEAEALRKLEKSAELAQERIQAAAEKAQKMIDDACTVATAALETSSRIPDKRNINGSFQWDRGDRYRRGSDDRLNRLEERLIEIDKCVGDLEVGQAKREEQIIALIHDIAGLKDIIKEIEPRLTTIQELSLQIKDATAAKLDKLRDETQKDKIRNQQYVIGIVVGIIVTFLSSIVFAYFRT